MVKNAVLDEVKKELSRKYNKKEVLIKMMLEKSLVLGYNIESSKKNIKEFYKNFWDTNGIHRKRKV